MTDPAAVLQERSHRAAGSRSPGLSATSMLFERTLFEAATRRLPHVQRAEWAMIVDEETATCAGESQWISGHGSRDHAHHLRGCMDAIIVGVGTVLLDDPQLTARLNSGRGSHALLEITSAGLLDKSHRLDGAQVSTCWYAPGELSVTRSRRWSRLVAKSASQNSENRVTIVKDLLEDGSAAVRRTSPRRGRLPRSCFDSRQIDRGRCPSWDRSSWRASALGPVGGDGVARLQEAACVRASSCAASATTFLSTALSREEVETPAELDGGA